VIQISGYTIKREIGTGGMATVYLAEQSSLEREVALKVMNAQLASDPNFALRFLQEARTLASLAHPHIVAVYDVGTTDSGMHYFSMQHLPGGDLIRRIKEGIGEQELLPILTGVARALSYAHQRGIVHRDVSPANVLFDMNLSPVLTDFGIARAVTRGSRLTSAGVSVGTSHYMSPEQARGGDVDARSDIYSLGATVFESLTGKPPYDGEDGFAIAYAHVFEAVPRLPAAVSHWQGIIDKALAKDPRERFQSMDEFIAALSQLGGSTGNIPKPFVDPSTVAMARPVLPPAPETPASPATKVAEPLPKAAATAKAAAPATPAQPAAPAKSAPTPAPAPAPAAKPTPTPAPPSTPKAPVREAVSSSNGKPPSRALPIALIVIALLVLAVAGWALMTKRGGSDPAPSATTPTSPKTIAANPPPAPVPSVDPPPASTSDAPAIPDPNDPSLPPDGSEVPIGDVLLDPAQEAALAKLAAATTVVDPVKEAMRLGTYSLTRAKLLPPGLNALDQFKLALRLDPRNEKARQGVLDVAGALFTQAEKKLAENRLDEFLDLAKRAEDVATGLAADAKLQPRDGQAVVQRIVDRKRGLRDDALATGRKALADWDKAGATAAFERVLRIEPSNGEAQRGAKTAERVGEVGYTFRDAAGAGESPEMGIVSVGGRKLAVARSETTVADFKRYWSARGGKTRGADRPSCRDRESIFRSSRSRNFQTPFDKPELAQDGEHPVVCVASADADDFAKWLAAETGKRYRLPTTAELDALGKAAKPGACRANLADARYARVLSERAELDCDDGSAATARVRSYDADGNGLFDIAGNVREWASDCPGCRGRMAVGSAWLTGVNKNGAVPRENFDADVSTTSVGFRVVREID